MKVNAHQTQIVSVEIDAEDVAKRVAFALLRSHGLHLEAYVKGGKIVYDEEHGGGSHSWFDTKVLVEKPTKEQLQLLSSVQLFMEETRKMYREKSNRWPE